MRTKVTIKKHTGIEEARKALKVTNFHDKEVLATLAQVYTWMHSPVRTQVFEIHLESIPSFVATHLSRHVTTQPFITTSRYDRGADVKSDRWTPVDMIIWANAESLMSMANKRLCYKSSKETRDVMIEIKLAMNTIDSDLQRNLQPACVFQGGYCREPQPCGSFRVRRFNIEEILYKIV